MAPNDFHDLDTVHNQLLDFQNYWQSTGRPFEWKFNRDVLRDLLARIDTRETLATAA